jgi:hypothetical protein
MNKLVGVIGSRKLPAICKGKVKEVVSRLLDKGYDIASGGAIGADQYALEALLELGAAKRGVIFAAWENVEQFPADTREQVKEFVRLGGRIVWGNVPHAAPRPAVVAGLLGRNVRLVSGASGLVAFPYGESRGTRFTIRKVPMFRHRRKSGSRRFHNYLLKMSVGTKEKNIPAFVVSFDPHPTTPTPTACGNQKKRGGAR